MSATAWCLGPCAQSARDLILLPPRRPGSNGTATSPRAGCPARSDKRAAERRRIAFPGQIVWKDARGTTRMAPVVTRDVSDQRRARRVPGRDADPAVPAGVLPGRSRGPQPRRPAADAAEVERAVGDLPRRAVPPGHGRAERYALRLLVEPVRKSPGRPRRPSKPTAPGPPSGSGRQT